MAHKTIMRTLLILSTISCFYAKPVTAMQSLVLSKDKASGVFKDAAGKWYAFFQPQYSIHHKPNDVRFPASIINDSHIYPKEDVITLKSYPVPAYKSGFRIMDSPNDYVEESEELSDIMGNTYRVISRNSGPNKVTLLIKYPAKATQSLVLSKDKASGIFKDAAGKWYAFFQPQYSIDHKPDDVRFSASIIDDSHIHPKEDVITLKSYPVPAYKSGFRIMDSPNDYIEESEELSDIMGNTYRVTSRNSGPNKVTLLIKYPTKATQSLVLSKDKKSGIFKDAAGKQYAFFQPQHSIDHKPNDVRFLKSIIDDSYIHPNEDVITLKSYQVPAYKSICRTNDDPRAYVEESEELSDTMGNTYRVTDRNSGPNNVTLLIKYPTKATQSLVPSNVKLLIKYPTKATQSLVLSKDKASGVFKDAEGAMYFFITPHIPIDYKPSDVRVSGGPIYPEEDVIILQSYSVPTYKSGLKNRSKPDFYVGESVEFIDAKGNTYRVKRRTAENPKEIYLIKAPAKQEN